MDNEVKFNILLIVLIVVFILLLFKYNKYYKTLTNSQKENQINFKESYYIERLFSIIVGILTLQGAWYYAVLLSQYIFEKREQDAIYLLRIIFFIFLIGMWLISSKVKDEKENIKDREITALKFEIKLLKDKIISEEKS